MADKSLAFTKPAIRRVMKLNDEVSNIQPEAVATVDKMLELFITQLAKECVASATAANRKAVKVSKCRSRIPNYFNYLYPLTDLSLPYCRVISHY